MKQNAGLYMDLDRILLTRDEIAAKVHELGQQITRDYEGKKPVLVCILKGASVFFADLIREIELPLTLDFMAISSYGSATKTSGVVRILNDLDNDILGKDVIVVEDIVDSGVTLSYLTKILMQRGAKSLRIATLLDSSNHRKPRFRPRNGKASSTIAAPPVLRRLRLRVASLPCARICSSSSNMRAGS